MSRSFQTVVIALSLLASSVWAQLGLKDGHNLSPTDLEPVRVGSPAPDFTLKNMDGKGDSLSDFAVKRNAVLVFQRGHW